MPEQATPFIEQGVVIFWHAPHIVAIYLPIAFRGVAASLLLRVGTLHPAQQCKVGKTVLLSPTLSPDSLRPTITLDSVRLQVVFPTFLEVWDKR